MRTRCCRLEQGANAAPTDALLFARVGRDGLWSRDLRSGEVSLLSVALPASRPRAHTSDAGGVHLSTARREIVYQPLDGSAPRVLHPAVDSDLANATLSLSPDRRSLLLSLTGREFGDIELLTNLDAIASR
jgi:hypothetical protein